MKLIPLIKADAGQCACRTCGGAVEEMPFGVTYAGWYYDAGSKIELHLHPRDGFRDPVWLDDLTQYFDGGLYRIWPSERYLTKGGKKLHRDVWSDAFGKIPKGCHIHHKDSDPKNNRLSNLECIPASDHLSQTWRDKKAGLKASEHFTEDARAKAAEWHSSPEGREWHKRHAQRSQSWTKWKREPKNCPQCGNEFNALARKSGNSQIYCSTPCKAAAYRARRP